LTLVEMLVTVALLLLIMTVIVSIFRSAATATSAQKTYIELENTLRRFDATIRQDLQGATARMTPPLNPKDNLGYFEYGENSLADAQGEDADDYLAFTAKAPEGQPFRGYVVVQGGTANNPQFIRVPITSEFAEIIYFHRNGNLYRRVLLIVPERQGSMTVGPNRGGYWAVAVSGGFQPTAANNPLRLPVSWQAMNTISARPSPFGTSSAPIPNTLGDLTNRENRFARPRFSSDYTSGPANSPPDGLPDDTNGDGIPDYYPSLYPTLPQVNEFPAAIRVTTVERMPFPYLFSGEYSQRTPGGIHVPATATATANVWNHLPIDPTEGKGLDNLPLPTGTVSTWWGFPTYQESASPYWTDPVKRINDPANAPYFGGFPNNNTVDPAGSQAPGLSWGNLIPLPPMTTALIPNTNTPYRRSAQSFSDGAGSPVFAQLPPPVGGATWQPDTLWQYAGEADDLILTGVRSFDIKAYDPAARQYVDLGYGLMPTTPPFVAISGTIVGGVAWNEANVQSNPNLPWNETLRTFAHEGRMPPILSNGTSTGDFRLDAHYPVFNAQNPASSWFVGDTNAATIRMRRVYDTWSTDYAYPPDTAFNNPVSGPLAGQRPVYPGFEAPYPVPLTGIQIHVRIADPRNERIKVLTIKQDFTDKL
jgi:type II secretory pathway component PulJ